MSQTPIHDPSRADVSAYLSKRLATPVTVTSLRKTFPGISRETWLVTASVLGAESGFVVRIDPPSGPSVPQSLRHEWEVYSRLWRSPIPVAEPLWYDEAIDFADGRPHMVRRLIDGATSPPDLLAQTDEGARRRRAVVFEHMEKLAAVHTLDWKSYGFDTFIDAPAEPADALAADFRYWKSLWTSFHVDPFPLTAEALAWLESQLPTDTPRISLVKGNNGIGEEIWKDDKIVAMSDWELASLGDGVLDLAFSQGTLDLIDRREAIRYYEQCVGDKVSPERIAFASFWIPFKAMVCLNVYRLPPFFAGRDNRISALSNGMLSVRWLESRLAPCIGRNIVDAWREQAGESASIYAELGTAR